MKTIVIVMLMMLRCAGVSLAQSTNEGVIRQRINQAASQMKTMQCDFVQTKHMKMLNEEMVSSGKMYYQQANKLRWEYIHPYSYVFVLNDAKVLIQNNQRKDIIDVKQNKMFREIARIMMNSVVGKCLADEKDFQVSIGENPTEWVATLLPLRKDMKQMFKKIILHFDRKQYMVSQVELIEKSDDKTVIVLKNIQKNKSLHADVFQVN